MESEILTKALQTVMALEARQQAHLMLLAALLAESPTASDRVRVLLSHVDEVTLNTLATEDQRTEIAATLARCLATADRERSQAP